MILIGTHYHSGDETALRRQASARESLLALNHAQLVDLQFEDSQQVETQGIETIRALRNDSRKASGLPGRRTPIWDEMCRLLARVASERGLDYFMVVNADEQVMQPAIETVSEQGLEGYIFSRMDFAAETLQEMGVQSGGQGCWVIQTTWWQRNRKLFRPYVYGESLWDNISTAKMLCHGHARLFNRTGEFVRHEAHPRVWDKSPFLHYTRYLASLDAPYLAVWHRYIERLQTMRAKGATEEDELKMQREVFRLHLSTAERIWHAGRCLKAWLRFRTGLFSK